jgi:hypothetical protein
MVVPSRRGGSGERIGETGGSELARPALIPAAPPSAAWPRRGIVLDRYFTRVAILPTFVVMVGVFGMPLAFSFYLSFTGYAAVQRRLRRAGELSGSAERSCLYCQLHGGRCGSGNGTGPWHRVVADPHARRCRAAQALGSLGRGDLVAAMTGDAADATIARAFVARWRRGARLFVTHGCCQGE